MSTTRTLVHIGLFVGLYYVLPGVGPESAAVRGLRVVVAVLLLVVLVRLVVRTVLAEVRAGSTGVHPNRLLLAVVGGVVAFAYADLQVALLAADQFVGIQTRTDALYFALTTFTTVGYGDIHPSGQLARGLVIGQLLFNLVVLASATRMLTRAVDARRHHHDPRDATEPGN